MKSDQESLLIRLILIVSILQSNDRF